jgi:hypothetical protein
MDDRLWHQHLQATFPASCRGRDIHGIDLTTLDADTAGCLKTYFALGRALTIGHVAILGRCYHDLGIVQPQLTGDASTYFHRLEQVAGAVLDSLSTAGFEA